MKLLVVGSGGREHAIAKKLLESKDVEQVFVATGNDGMTLDGLDLINIGISEHSKLIDFAKANDKFEIKGAAFEGKVQDVDFLATLPTYDEAIARLMGTMKEEAAGKLVRTLAALRDKLQEAA